jgi:hypothetical protein
MADTTTWARGALTSLAGYDHCWESYLNGIFVGTRPTEREARGAAELAWHGALEMADISTRRIPEDPPERDPSNRAAMRQAPGAGSVPRRVILFTQGGKGAMTLYFRDGAVCKALWRLRPEHEERVARKILEDNPDLEYVTVGEPPPRGRVVRRPGDSWIDWLEAK